MTVKILTGDCRDVLRTLPSESVHCVVTSPPYFGLRDYGMAGQIGLELSPSDFVQELVSVFRDVKRVLRNDGTLWLNLGDSYAGSWGAQSHRITESDDPSWHSSQIKNHPKRASGTGSIREAGLKPKDLIGIPWRVAFALQASGWWLRQDIIWSKPNPMPESVTDRCTKAHEYLFLLSKSDRYHYNAAAISETSVYGGEELGILRGDKSRAEAMGRTPSGNEAVAVARRESKARGEFNAKPGTPEGREPFRAITETRNKRSVWTVTTQAFSEAHFATFPPALIEPCIKAGCPEGGTVLDPFGGAGTTGLVADRLGRNAILIELNPEYAAMAERRITADAPLFAEAAVA